MLASSSDDETIIIWNAETGQQLQTLKGHTSGVVSVAWLPDGNTLVSGGGDKAVRFWEASGGRALDVLEGHNAWIRELVISPNGQTLASASYDHRVGLWNLPKRQLIRFLEGHADRVHSAKWSTNGEQLATASKDSTVRIWSTAGTCLRILEGHTGPVYDLSFSMDGVFLASKGLDSTVRIWNCQNWTCAAVLTEVVDQTFFGGLSFHPHKPLLATLGDRDTVVRVWDFDSGTLLNSAPQPTALSTSAKVVLVGESNMGKSCLALRLAENRYEEQGSTHGLRFWVLDPEQLSHAAASPVGEHRDVVLWDMGGQDEYRLVHQMFLHDTTIALVLFDPTRGKSAFDDVEAWNAGLEKQLRGRQAIKMLVGTKLDEPSTLVDKASVERLVKECNFSGYFPTSAKTASGVQALGEAIAQAINWDMMAKATRPEVFQKVHDEIELCRAQGEVAVSISELCTRLNSSGEEEVEVEAVNTVASQLALQGIVAITALASGDRVLVLRIEEIERYACSIILAARDSLRGFAAVEERWLSSREAVFPGVKEPDRLPWSQERIVLECVVQLLIVHDICLRHEGLLVFPSLFPDRASRDESNLPHSVSLHYDFTGAIDNIYASLVARLCLSGHFGRYRLWKNSAEWELPSGAICGLRKVSYRSGVAHLDVYFAEEVDIRQRDIFYVFIEDHFRLRGVEIKEAVQVTCACGKRFQEDDVRARLAAGKPDIQCPICERKSSIVEGASKLKSRDPGVEHTLIALKTVIDKGHQSHVAKAKAEIRAGGHEIKMTRILHLSDLHMTLGSDPDTMCSQLVADLRDPSGLNISRLDYLVVTGDLTSRAAPAEFDKAYTLVSKVLETFGLNSARCMIVPGNHDVCWDEMVYRWVPSRMVNFGELKDGEYVRQGDGVLIRDKQLYPRRFANFSDKFYKFLIQEEYPLDFEEQATPFLFTESNIQLLALNSCWEIDEFFRSRSSICAGALARGLERADEQLRKARGDRAVAVNAKLLRIAIWHHPLNGSDAIKNDAFLDRLRQASFRLCLHGHVHEERTDLIGYTSRSRRLYVAGAGSFNAKPSERPDGIPRLYNLMEIPRDQSEIKVHTRCLRKEGGAWEGWAVWEGESPEQRLTYYKIPISDLTSECQ